MEDFNRKESYIINKKDSTQNQNEFVINQKTINENSKQKENSIEKESNYTETENTEKHEEDESTDLIIPLDRSNFYDIRIATMGNVDAGKSTLVGVLTSGILDNGRGLARSKVFRMKHEAVTGRTSSIAQHLLGFNSKKEAVYQPTSNASTAAAKNKQWRSVMEQASSAVTFIDLCGHEKYLKTTIAGLTGMYADFAMLIVGANMGVSKMTKEHLGVALALEIPSFVVITKIDMSPPDVLKDTVKQLFKVLKSPAANKIPLIVRNEDDIKSALNTETAGFRVCPIFLVSSVKGTNIDLLINFLSQLKSRYFDPSNKELLAGPSTQDEFDIDEVYQVTGVGTVVSGTVRNGNFNVNSKFMIGPFHDGTFKPVLIRSIHMKRTPVDGVKRGDSCAMNIRPLKKKENFTRDEIRKGMVIVDSTEVPNASFKFRAEVLILTHHTTIKVKYQPVIHCGNIRQTAAVEAIDKDVIRTGDKAVVDFKFLVHPEYLHVGSKFVFREGNTKGVGTILQVIAD